MTPETPAQAVLASAAPLWRRGYSCYHERELESPVYSSQLSDCSKGMVAVMKSPYPFLHIPGWDHLLSYMAIRLQSPLQCFLPYIILVSNKVLRAVQS